MNSVTFSVTPDLKVERVDINDYHVATKDDESKKTVVASSHSKNQIRVESENGFVHAVIDAYNGHHNLILRPDDVWLAIMVQFAFYLQANSEELRSQFVDHKGTTELEVVDVGTLMTADYRKLSLKMAEEISKNIKDPKIKEWVIPSFSTSTTEDKVVGSMVLMAAASKFFTYKFSLMCGLTNVTLEGSEEDWVNLYFRMEQLVKFDNKSQHMQKWSALLKPILEQFIMARQGKPDLDFWKNVCSHHSNGSGSSYVSGWITAFTVFTEEGDYRGDDNVFPQRRKDPVKFMYPVVDTNEIASGRIQVDVLVNDNGVKHSCEIVAGHQYIEIADKYSIQPGVGWKLFKK